MSDEQELPYTVEPEKPSSSQDPEHQHAGERDKVEPVGELPVDDQMTVVHERQPSAPRPGPMHPTGPWHDELGSQSGGASGGGFRTFSQPPVWPGSPQTGASRRSPSPGDHVPWEAAASWGPTTLTMSANTAAGVSYLFWWISGLLVYFNERQNRYVRFHAIQSILLTGALTVCGVFASILAALCTDLALATHLRVFQAIGNGIAVLALVTIVVAWLVAMIAAWTGNYLRLPIVGAYAERYAAPPLSPPVPPSY